MAKKNAKKEVGEIEKSYESIAGKSKKKASSGKGRVVGIVISSVAVLLIAAMFTVVYFFPDLLKPFKVRADISIGGTHLMGLSRSEALDAINQAVSGYAQNTMTVTAGEQTVELTPEISGISVDTAAVLDAALMTAPSATEFDILPFLNLNEAAIRNVLQVIVDTNQTELVHGTYEITGSADTLAGTTDMKLILTTGHPGINADIDMIYDQVVQAYRENCFAVDYALQVVQPNNPDLDQIAQDHTLAAVDAVMDSSTFQITPHSYGYTFDLEQAKAALQEAAYSQVIEIPFTICAPTVLEADLTALLFRDVLGTYTAKSSSKPNSRDINLALSCEKINGKILYPGEVFDYNKALGERTPEAGWKKADGYSYGDTVSVYGGGICQASSALYYCTLIADVEIVTRINHSYVSSYMPLGMDATVSWGGPEFRFKNTTAYPIRIDAYAEKGNVTVTLVGTDTKDYYVEMEYELLKKDPYETVYREMTPEEANGRKDGSQIVSGYTGHKVVTYKCKYNKETKELISREEEATSTYKRRDRVLCKIVDPNAPTESAPVETPPTETTAPSEPTPPVGNDPILDGGGIHEDG